MIEKRMEEILQLTFLQRLIQYASIQDELADLEAQARESSERCKVTFFVVSSNTHNSMRLHM